MTNPSRRCEPGSICVMLIVAVAVAVQAALAAGAAVAAQPATIARPAPGAQAATPPPPLPAAVPVLKLIELSDAQYPTLAATVTVLNKTSGLYLTGLTAADFSLTVGITPTEISRVTPVTLATEASQIVLVVDHSVPEAASLDAVKAAAQRFIDGLGPQDQVALLAVADAVRVAAPLSIDRQQIQTALAGLSRVTTKTIWHQGLVQAGTLLGVAPPGGGQRIIVGITNSGDNAHPIFPSANVISQAQSASAPIYIINYTGVDAGGSLGTIAQQTGGHYFALSGVDQIDGSLQTILSGMHQGYVVDFASPVPGDGNKYSARLALASAPEASPVEATFVAPLKAIVINGPGVADGQTVIGAVQLDTTAMVPVPPLASVQYLVDGQSLATLTAPPFNFHWDSTSVNPGPHRLKVLVRDSAGNQSEAEVTVQVALPFAVTASSDQEKVPIGDKVIIRAQVNSPARIAYVEFLGDDDALIIRDSTAPYECTIDTRGQAPGVRRFKVRAVDYLGRSAETGIFQIELRPTVASTMPAIGRWALIGLNTLAILVAVLIAIFGSLALGNRLRRQLLSRFTVEISNEGNLRNRYNLRAEAEPGALSLEFQLQGAALPTQSVAIAPAPELGPEAEPIAAIAEPTPPPASGQATGSGPSIGAVKNTGAFKTFQRGSGILSAVAGFLNAVAGLLPAGAAASLRSTATNLQQGQSVSYEIDRADAKVKMVQHASTNTAQAVAGEPSGPTPAPTATGAPPRTIARGAPAAARGRRPSLTETWAVTPYVEAGEKLSLQLCAKPLKSTRTQTYGIRILSRLAEGPEPAPVNEVGDIKVAGLTRLQRLQPFSLALVMLAIAAGLTALLIRLWGA